jgi:CHAT domain-containing protein
MKSGFHILLPIFSFAIVLSGLNQCSNNSVDEPENPDLSTVLETLQSINWDSIQLQCRQNKNYARAESFQREMHPDSVLLHLDRAIIEFRTNSQSLEEILSCFRLMQICLEVEKNETFVTISKRMSILLESFVSGKDTLAGNIFNLLGDYYNQTEENDSALHYYNLALNNFLSTGYRDSLCIAGINKDLADIYNWRRNEYYTSLKYYSAALHIYQALKLKEHKPEIVCLNNMAAASRKMGESEKAYAYALKMLSLLEDSIPAHQFYKEVCYSLLGTIQFSKRELPSSIEYYQKAIGLNRSNFEQPNSFLLNHYNNLILAHIINGDPDSALITGNFVRSEVASAVHDEAQISYLYEYLGYANEREENYDTALSLFKEVLDLRLNIFEETSSQVPDAYLFIGQIFNKMGNPDSSIFYYRKSVEKIVPEIFSPDAPDFNLTDRIGNKFFLIPNIHGIANYYAERYISTNNAEFLRNSMELYKLCDTLLDQSRAQLQFQESKLMYTSQASEIYEDAIKLLYHAHVNSNDSSYLELIFHFMEKKRSRILLDNVHRQEFQFTVEGSDTSLQYNSHIHSKLYEIQEKLNRLTIRENSSEYNQLQSSLFDLIKEVDRTELLLKEKYPRYFELENKSGSIYISELQEKLQNETIIEYLWGEQVIYALKITRNEADIIQIPNSDNLRTQITNLLSSLRNDSLYNDRGYEQFINSAGYIFETLVAPLTGSSFDLERDGIKNLIIIPDGEISFIPFEVLLYKTTNSNTINYKDLDYLISQVNIYYAFSGSYLFLNDQSKIKPGTRILAFAPSNDNNSETVSEGRTIRNDKNALPGSISETREIAEHLRGRFMFGNDASETSFKQLSPDYKLIHLALHGYSDPLDYRRSTLLFNKETDSLNDGLLYPYELISIPLNAELIVLSACETGIGKYQSGEGLLSIGWAFAYSGCKSLITSLWKANDYHTMQLMNNFYSSIQDRHHATFAISESKRKFLQQADELSAHPANWATFVYYGSGIQTQSSLLGRPYFYLLLSLGIFLFLTLFLIKHKSDRTAGKYH